MNKIKNIMLDSVKKILRLHPPAQTTGVQDSPLQIQVGVQGQKVVIKLDRHVDTITLDRMQLTNFLSALASRASLIK